MQKQPKKTITCHQCPGIYCYDDYPKGMPDFCQATVFPKSIERATNQYSKPEIRRLHEAAAKVRNEGNCLWPRIKETIEFAKELGITKIGIATCVVYLPEVKELAAYLTGTGFEVWTISCFIGAVKDEKLGVPEKWRYPRGISCNPIAQAEVLNDIGTELNLMYGLCVGHDTLFTMHSKAPNTTVLVKDRVTGDNPGAVLRDIYWRIRLETEYSGREEKGLHASEIRR